MPITFRTYATNTGFYTGKPLPSLAGNIPPFRVGGNDPELKFKLPSVNAAKSNFLDTNTQGGNPTASTRHFRILVADWGKFYNDTYECNSILYTASVEHIDGTYNNFWTSNNVAGLTTATDQNGHAEYNMKLRVGDKVHATVNVDGGNDDQEVRIYIEDDDRLPAVTEYNKVDANGLKFGVPITTQKHVVLDVCGVASEVLDNNTLNFVFEVEA
tara:strand:+ start:495 stop:1136 length:642 start_codon:yes stop_codon:yes gene_type:complete